MTNKELATKIAEQMVKINPIISVETVTKKLLKGMTTRELELVYNRYYK